LIARFFCHVSPLEERKGKRKCEAGNDLTFMASHGAKKTMNTRFHRVFMARKHRLNYITGGIRRERDG
jgi:hypothetical protein